MDLTQAVKRLFQFVEVESNIGLEQLEGNTYKVLKSHIGELLRSQSPRQDADDSPSNRKRFSGKKRQLKANSKDMVIGAGDNSHTLSQEDSKDSQIIYNSPNSGMPYIEEKRMPLDLLTKNLKKSISKMVTRSQKNKTGKRKSIKPAKKWTISA